MFWTIVKYLVGMSFANIFFRSMDFLLTLLNFHLVVFHIPKDHDLMPLGAAAHCLEGLGEKQGA